MLPGSAARFGRLALACVALVLALGVLAAIVPIEPRASLASVARLALHVGVAALVYAGALGVLRSPELAAVTSLFRRGSG